MVLSRARLPEGRTQPLAGIDCAAGLRNGFPGRCDGRGGPGPAQREPSAPRRPRRARPPPPWRLQLPAAAAPGDAPLRTPSSSHWLRQSPIRRRRRARPTNGKAVANTPQLFLARLPLAHLADQSPPPRLGRPSAEGGGTHECEDKVVHGLCAAERGAQCGAQCWRLGVLVHGAVGTVVPPPALPGLTLACVAWSCYLSPEETGL